MLKLIEVSKEFNTDNRRIELFHNVNIELPTKGLVFITGESGSGKSTLLNIIGSYEKPTKGEISYKYNKLFNSYYRRNIISFVFQDFNLFKELSIIDNLNVASATDVDNITKIMQYLNLNMKPTTKVKYLSMGEQQRLALVRALLKNYEILLMDEPTSSLDEMNSKILMDSIKKISKEKLVIVITHKKEDVIEYGDYEIEIKDKSIKEIKKIDSNNLKEIQMNKEFDFESNPKKVLPFKLQLKYVLTLIWLNKLKFIVSAIILTLFTGMTFFFINEHFLDYDKTMFHIYDNDKNNNYIIKESYSSPQKYSKLAEKIEIDEYAVFIQPSDPKKQALRLGVKNTYKNITLKEGRLPEKDNEILITDYATTLNTKYKIGGIYKLEMVNHKADFIISGIIKTNYTDEEVEELEKHKELDYLFGNYNYILTSKNSFINHIGKTGFKAFDEITIEETKGKIDNDSTTYHYENQNIIFGRKPMNENEIVVSENLLKKYKINDPKSIIDKQISLRATFLQDVIKESRNYNRPWFYVVGITDQKGDCYVHKDYNFIEYDNDSDQNYYFMTGDLTHSKVKKHLKNFMFNYNRNIKNFFELKELVQFKTLKTNVFKVFMSLTILFIYFFSVVTISKSRKEVAVLKSLGISKLKIFNLFYMYNLLYSFTGFISGIGGVFILRYLIMGAENRNSIHNIIFLESYSIFIGVLLVVPIITTILSMLNIKLVSISKELKVS